MDELHGDRGSRPLVEPSHVDAVRDLLGSHEPSLETVMKGRARLLAEAAATATAGGESERRGREPARKRRRGRLAGVGLGLAASAAALVMVSNGTITVLPRPSISMSPSAGPAGSPVPGERPTARYILLAAAGAIAQARADGDYWHTATVSKSMMIDPTRSYVIETSRSEERWLAQRPDRQSWRISRYLGAQPATPRDEAAWQVAGAPSSWRYSENTRDLFATSFETVVAAADEPIAARLRGGWEGAGGHLAKEPMTWKELRAIPDEPGKLRSYLEKHITRQEHKRPGSAMDLEEMTPHLRQACLQVVDGLPVSPEVRASAYRILASLPGMRAEGEVTDPVGRRGQGLSYQVEASPGRITDIRLVIDPGTGLPLAEVTTTSGELANGQRVEIRYSTSYQAIGWTDEQPGLPARRD